MAVLVLPDNGSVARSAAGVAIDRTEALIRDLAGVALRDEALRDDAARRLMAAEARERALRLYEATLRRG